VAANNTGRRLITKLTKITKTTKKNFVDFVFFVTFVPTRGACYHSGDHS